MVENHSFYPGFGSNLGRSRYTTGGLSNRAAIGDLFGNDPTQYTSFIAIKELMTPVTM